eukprot:754660-Hanusia_phi.AAC.7
MFIVLFSRGQSLRLLAILALACLLSSCNFHHPRCSFWPEGIFLQASERVEESKGEGESENEEKGFGGVGARRGGGRRNGKEERIGEGRGGERRGVGWRVEEGGRGVCADPSKQSAVFNPPLLFMFPPPPSSPSPSPALCRFSPSPLRALTWKQREVVREYLPARHRNLVRGGGCSGRLTSAKMKKFEEHVAAFGGVKEAAAQAQACRLPLAQDLSERYDECVKSLQ